MHFFLNSIKYAAHTNFLLSDSWHQPIMVSGNRICRSKGLKCNGLVMQRYLWPLKAYAAPIKGISGFWKHKLKKKKPQGHTLKNETPNVKTTTNNNKTVFINIRCLLVCLPVRNSVHDERNTPQPTVDLCWNMWRLYTFFNVPTTWPPAATMLAIHVIKVTKICCLFKPAH